jgi:hypothetical protein
MRAGRKRTQLSWMTYTKGGRRRADLAEAPRWGGSFWSPPPSIRARCNGLVALALSRKAPQASSCSGR